MHRLLILSIFLTTNLAGAAYQDEFLERFAKNPAVAMQEQAPKFDRAGNLVKLPLQKSLSDQFFASREVERERMCITDDHGELHCLAHPGREGFAGNEDPRYFVDNPDTMIRSLAVMDQKNLRQAELLDGPWSSDYWPIRSGQLANRYLDQNFPRDGAWKDAYTYYQSNPSQGFDQDRLSPAEKYDLLVGDKDWSLTKAQWNAGLAYQMRFGDVESWMGICHGWAPASIMVKRPSKSIVMTAADGHTKVKFLPDDIKALASLKWASGVALDSNNHTGTKFLGGRCDIKNPKKDEATGRLLDPECFDTNPGVWHLSLVNQLGLNKRSFIIDATYDLQVWNQPVLSYRYSYFNPFTQKRTENLDEARVVMGQGNDIYAKFRKNPKAKYLVGIVMDLTYVSEVLAQNRETDSPANDYTNTVRYHYDLELAEDGSIVGGEWYLNQHPDFIWTPAPNTFAWNEEDRSIKSSLGADGKIPEDIISIAPYASQNGRPLKAVVDGLISLSH